MAKPLAQVVAMLTPKRRWFQFRLRTLFVVITLCGVGLGIGHMQNRVDRQRAGVAAIQALGGRVQYDNPDLSTTGVFYKRWLQRWLPRDYFVEVSDVFLKRGTDGDLAQLQGHLESLSGLKRLGFFDTFRLSDAGLKHLHGLTGLKELHLGLRTRRRKASVAQRVTDAGVAELQQALPNCRIER